jgi:hypothetical protein
LISQLRNRDTHFQRLRTAAEDYPAHRRHVTEIAAPGQHHVLLFNAQIIGRIKLDPTQRRRIHGHPGM